MGGKEPRRRWFTAIITAHRSPGAFTSVVNAHTNTITPLPSHTVKSSQNLNADNNFCLSPPPRYPPSPPSLLSPHWPMKEAMPVLTAGAGETSCHRCSQRTLSIPLDACCAPSVHVNLHEGFPSFLCRATRDVGPADLSAAARCQSQRGHGLPQRRLQWEELGIPNEGEVLTPSDSMSNIMYTQLRTVEFVYAILEYAHKIVNVSRFGREKRRAAGCWIIQKSNLDTSC